MNFERFRKNGVPNLKNLWQWKLAREQQPIPTSTNDDAREKEGRRKRERKTGEQKEKQT